MGRAIVYCGDCGRSLSEREFSRGEAHDIGGISYCSECRAAPEPPKESARVATPTPRRASPAARSHRTQRFMLDKPPKSRGGGSGVLIGGAIAGGAVLIILIAIVASGGGGPVSTTGDALKQAVKDATPPPANTRKARVEQEMAAQAGQGKAKQFDNFMGQIRGLMEPKVKLPFRKNEIDGMLTSARKMEGARVAEVDALRREFEQGLKEAELETVLASIKDTAAAYPDILDAKPQVEQLLQEALAVAGSRRAEVEALAKEYAGKFEAAVKDWKAEIDFEQGYEKKLYRSQKWGGGGYKHTRKAENVHGGGRALHLDEKYEGGEFWVAGIREGVTYVASCWAMSSAPSDKVYVGFEFYGVAGDKPLVKEGLAVDSASYKEFAKEMKAPPGSARLKFWVWKDKAVAGQCFVDDVKIAVK